MGSAANDRRVIQLEIEPGLVCLRGLSPTRLRFEVEYGLERGTTANSFLFLPSGAEPALLVHPPGNTFAEPYLEALACLVPSDTRLQVVGATSEREAGFTEGLTPFGQRQLQAGIEALLPEASQWPPMERWWGFRPCTPDEGPLLGPSAVTGLWLATGHHRNGVLLAAITAELVGRCVHPDDCSPAQHALLDSFRWDRFNN